VQLLSARLKEELKPNSSLQCVITNPHSGTMQNAHKQRYTQSKTISKL